MCFVGIFVVTVLWTVDYSMQFVSIDLGKGMSEGRGGVVLCGDVEWSDGAMVLDRITPGGSWMRDEHGSIWQSGNLVMIWV
jgi:hypothetical protein